MADVRSTTDTPTVDDFGIGNAVSRAGTPLVVDRVNEVVYFLNASDVVTPVAGGGGGAPTNATYVVMSLNGALSAERVLTAGAGISITDGGANGPVTIAATGGSVASGTVTLDFGGSPTAETDVALASVADAGVLAGSEITATLQYAATADHTADEALITPINLAVGNITAGVGFDIHGYCFEQAWGKFSVAWVRN